MIYKWKGKMALKCCWQWHSYHSLLPVCARGAWQHQTAWHLFRKYSGLHRSIRILCSNSYARNVRYGFVVEIDGAIYIGKWWNWIRPPLPKHLLVWWKTNSFSDSANVFRRSNSGKWNGIAMLWRTAFYPTPPYQISIQCILAAIIRKNRVSIQCCIL